MNKKSFVFCVGCIVLLSSFSSCSFAQSGQDYLSKANTFYKNYEVSGNKEDLENAYLYYYKSAQQSPSLAGYLGMGRVFVEKHMYPQAKKYLYSALSIDKNDAVTNYYLAILAYVNEEYVRALDFLKIAYENGLSENYDVNLKMATIYEKVGDFDLAKNFYNSASKLNSLDNQLQNKLLSIDELEGNKNKYFESLN